MQEIQSTHVSFSHTHPPTPTHPSGKCRLAKPTFPTQATEKLGLPFVKVISSSVLRQLWPSDHVNAAEVPY